MQFRAFSQYTNKLMLIGFTQVQDVPSDDTAFWQEFREGVGKEFYDKPPTLRLLRQSQESFTNQKFTIPTWNSVKIPYPTPTDRRNLLKDVDFTIIDKHVLLVRTHVPLV